jgi:MoaA/NifB/PqqE/SkfB family radical SAM enzyme
MSTLRQIALGLRGARNFFFKKPLCVSFEITYSCNARCQHCHLGGIIKDEKRAPAEEFGRRARELSPVVAQISGGEPLLRRDLIDIIQAIHRPNRPPYIVLTTNAALLDEKKYFQLREAGVDEFSVSFDYPDERHDEFRGIPGLFRKIEKLCLALKGEPNKGITLSCVIHRYNYKELLQLAHKAYEWEVNLNFSTYTWLRTKKKDYLIPANELPYLEEMIRQIKDFRRTHNTIFTSDYVFKGMIDFFRDEGRQNCRAGIRFLVVNPDGHLSPCGLILKNFSNLRQLQNEFSATNQCTACFTSIRANSEKPAWVLLKDNLKST